MLGAGGSGIGAALGTERTIIQLSQIERALNEQSQRVEPHPQGGDQGEHPSPARIAAPGQPFTADGADEQSDHRVRPAGLVDPTQP
jgi:hypothetical protein